MHKQPVERERERIVTKGRCKPAHELSTTEQVHATFTLPFNCTGTAGKVKRLEAPMMEDGSSAGDAIAGEVKGGERKGKGRYAGLAG
jgi:hypothetical protein